MTPNVHDEGRAACGASLSIVLLGVSSGKRTVREHQKHCCGPPAVPLAPRIRNGPLVDSLSAWEMKCVFGPWHRGQRRYLRATKYAVVFHASKKHKVTIPKAAVMFGVISRNQSEMPEATTDKAKRRRNALINEECCSNVRMTSTHFDTYCGSSR